MAGIGQAGASGAGASGAGASGGEASVSRDDEFEPKYHQIEQALRVRIAGARAHDAVASEAQLCEEFGVSRMTARAALQRLVADGLVYRRVGRGTFVAPPAPPRRADMLVRFSAEMRRQGRRPSSRLLGAEVRPAGEVEAAQLELGKGQTEVVAVSRLRLADGVPVAIEHAVFPGELRALLHAELDGPAARSLHEALVRLGREPSRGHATLDARAASAEEALLLEVPVGAALLVERRLILDRGDRPVELTESRYVGARYGLQVAFTVDS
ncbi:GntR family transcriptional regulator [Dactylosporangium darangshiense]|uniref:GntR family transcriptional regulator n=1 Tax=Dactylosporangium darangshiense TaxID=579108 RepID=A0ABP8DJN3_9ACTN